MPTEANATRSPNEARVLDFARAFRSAARAVGFYPPTHQTVVAALDQVTAAARAATADGPVCLTILPQAFLAGGVPIDASETVVADLAALCHRHGVGAVNLDGQRHARGVAGASSRCWRASRKRCAARAGSSASGRPLRHREPRDSRDRLRRAAARPGRRRLSSNSPA